MALIRSLAFSHEHRQNCTGHHPLTGRFLPELWKAELKLVGCAPGVDIRRLRRWLENVFTKGSGTYKIPGNLEAAAASTGFFWPSHLCKASCCGTHRRRI